MADPLTRVAETVWVVAPIRLQRRFASLRGVVGDWHGLALVPPIAVLATVLTAVSFAMVGAFGLGFVNLYSESLLLMASLIALGAFSGQLGLIGLVSFALGDFLIRERTWLAAFGDGSAVEQVIRNRVPLIISYLLLAVAVLVIPRLGKNLFMGIGQWRRIPPDLAWLVATPATVLVSWLGLQTWAAFAPTLMRPYFYWRGRTPDVEAIQVFQLETSQLVAAGVAATVARQLAIGFSIYVPPIRARLAAMEARAYYHIMESTQETIALAPPPSKLVRLRADVLSALVASLVLSGILETRVLWGSYFGAFLVVRLLRSGTVRFGLLDRWKEIAARFPVVARLGFLWIGAALYRSSLTSEAVSSYRAMALVVLIGVVLSFIIFPGQTENDHDASSDRPPAGRPAIAGAAT